MEIKVQIGDTRLDAFMTSHLELSRTHIQRLIKEGHILVNGKETKSKCILQEGDKIKAKIPKPKKLETPAEDIPLDIIYEDENVIFVNKPAGMVVHPSDSGSHTTGTLVNALLHHCKKSLSGIGGVLRPGIVHRLDKDTSGVLVVAKNDEAHQMLSKQIKARRVEKVYIALVEGKVQPKEGKIDAPISRSSKDRKKMGISGARTARNAITEYKVIKYINEPVPCSLLEVKIITGRTHQIRVHFAAIEHPVVGDDVYGNLKVNRKFDGEGIMRQFLHAHKLTIRIPGATRKKTFTAEPPEDLVNFLKRV